MKNIKGITLISLVVTIVILIILASIGMYLALGENGIFNKAKYASEETNKQTATEKINLKITTAQMNTYAEKQQMPTLQELADTLCEDSEIQYVTLESKVASLDKVVVGEASSIFTKLKNYDYEFEINSSLQLASIDGVEVAETPNEAKGINYSFEEIKTNDTWIGKAIYTKTFYIESLPNATVGTYAHNIKDVDSIWIDWSNSFINWGHDGHTGSLEIAHSSDIKGQTETYVNKANIVIGANYDRSNLSAYVTVRYTKTTD